MTAIITAFTALLAALSRYWIVGLIVIGVLMLVLLFKDDERPRFSAEEAIDRKLDEIKSKEKKNRDMEYKCWLDARDHVIDDLKCRAYEAEVKLAASRKENEELKAEHDALDAENKTLKERLIRLRENSISKTKTIEAVDGSGNIIFKTQVDLGEKTPSIRLSLNQIDSLACHCDFVLVDNLLSRKDGMVGTYTGIPVYCTDWIGGED